MSIVPEHSAPCAAEYPLGPLTVALYVTPGGRDTSAGPSSDAGSAIGAGPPAIATTKSRGAAVPYVVFFTPTVIERLGATVTRGVGAVLDRPHVKENAAADPTATRTVTFITDRSGIALRHAVGIDNIMWSSDYPHHGNDWPYSRKQIEDTMGHIPNAEKSKIVGGNASRIWHLDD